MHLRAPTFSDFVYLFIITNNYCDNAWVFEILSPGPLPGFSSTIIQRALFNRIYIVQLGIVVGMYVVDHSTSDGLIP